MRELLRSGENARKAFFKKIKKDKKSIFKRFKEILD